MTYILGKQVPPSSSLEQGLIRIFGVGKVSSKIAYKNTGLLGNTKAKDLRKFHRDDLRKVFGKISIEKDFTEILAFNNDANRTQLIKLGTYRGQRHQIGKPVRGQRTHTNAKTQKKTFSIGINQNLQLEKNKIFKKKAKPKVVKNLPKPKKKK